MAECKPDNLVALYNIACILARQNKKEESIEWLDKAIRKGFNNWNFLNTDEYLENIRRSSYFISLRY
jgi:protein O-mannosyl-transferase